jgi:hypothetical protein
MRLKSLSARVTVPEFILNGRLATPAMLTRCRRGAPNLLHYCERQGAEFHPTQRRRNRRLTSLIEYENLLKDPKGLA